MFPIEILGFEILLADALQFLTIVLAFVVSYLSVKLRTIGGHIVALLKIIVSSVQKDSEDGKGLSDSEKELIWDQLKLIAKAFWQEFGKTLILKRLLKLTNLTPEETKTLE